MPKSLPRLQNRKGVYYYRRRVPISLIEKIGKPVIQFSLNTSDRKEALKLRAIHDVRWDSEFDTLQKAHGALTAAPVPSAIMQPSEIARLVCDYVRGADARRAEAFIVDPPQSEAERRAIRDDADMEISILSNLDDPRSAEFIHAAKTHLFHGAEGGAAVGELLRRGLIEIARRRLNRAEQGVEPHSLSSFLAPPPLPQVSFHEAAQRYLKEVNVSAKANGVSQKWVAKQTANVDTLEEIIGSDTATAVVNYDLCQKVRAALAELPAHRNKLFPGLSLPETISRAQSEEYALLSPTTQQQYLDTLRGILSLSVKRGLIPTNPAEGIGPLKRDTTPAAHKRYPFKQQQLAAFFGGSYYMKCAERQRPYEADPDGWRFWLPLLCLFLGLRPNEACQMSASDVKATSTGTPYLDILETSDEETEDAGKA